MDNPMIELLSSKSIKNMADKLSLPNVELITVKTDEIGGYGNTDPRISRGVTCWVSAPNLNLGCGMAAAMPQTPVRNSTNRVRRK